MPNVPHDVPVANESPTAIANIIAGRMKSSLPAELSTRREMNIFAPRLSVIALRVHAHARIIIAGTIALNPSGTEAIISLKLITLLIRKNIIVKMRAIDEP